MKVAKVTSRADDYGQQITPSEFLKLPFVGLDQTPEHPFSGYCGTDSSLQVVLACPSSRHYKVGVKDRHTATVRVNGIKGHPSTSGSRDSGT